MGRIFLNSPIMGLRAWPSPVRRGQPLRVAFATPVGARDQSANQFDVAVFDARGRRIATLARGPVASSGGMVSLEWNGRGPDGTPASPGSYLLRAATPRTGFKVERAFVVAG